MPYFDPHSSIDWNEANQLLLSNLNKLSHTLFPSENPADAEIKEIKKLRNCGTADAEIKDPYVENPELRNFL